MVPMTNQQTAALAFVIAGLYLAAPMVPEFVATTIQVVDLFREASDFSIWLPIVSFLPCVVPLAVGLLLVCKGPAFARRLFPDSALDREPAQDDPTARESGTSATDLLRAALVVMGIWMMGSGIVGLISPESMGFVVSQQDGAYRWLLSQVTWCLIGGVLILNPRPVVKYWRWRKRMDGIAFAVEEGHAEGRG